MKKLKELIEAKIVDNNSNMAYCNEIKNLDRVIEIGRENLVLYDVLLMILQLEKETLCISDFNEKPQP